MEKILKKMRQQPMFEVEIKKEELINAYAQNVSIVRAKELIAEKIKAVGLEDKEIYTDDEATKIYEQLKEEGGLIKAVAQAFLIRVEKRFRKKAEQARWESEERLKGVIEAIPDIIYFKDAQGRNVMINCAYERLIGLSREDILGRTDEKLVLVPLDLREMLKKGEEIAKKNGKRISIEGEIVDRNGRNRFFMFIKIPFYDENGNYTGILGIMRDITERKQTEIELKEKVKELEDFHDVAMDRELDMIKLEKEIDSLLIELGRPKKYTK